MDSAPSDHFSKVISKVINRKTELPPAVCRRQFRFLFFRAKHLIHRMKSAPIDEVLIV